MIDRISSLKTQVKAAYHGASAAFRLAAEVPVEPGEPKSPSGGRASVPSYISSSRTSESAFLPQDDLRLATLDTETLRATTARTPDLLRKLWKASPDLSMAIFANNRLAVTKSYQVIARSLDGTLHEEGTKVVQQLCRKFDLLGPMKGFNDYMTFRSCSEALTTELQIEGACALDLVLGKDRLPEGVRPVAVSKVKFKYDGNRRVPYQIIGGEEKSLDYPTFFYVALDQDLLTAYANSPIQSSIPVINTIQAFVNDLRRVFRRAIHPRLRALINTEAWKKSVPSSVRLDPVKLQSFQDDTITKVKSVLDGLNPEDALVGFDAVTFDYLTTGTNSTSDEYKVLNGMLESKLSAGTKAAPVVLGHQAAASTNIASTQSMLFVKSVEAGIQRKLDEIYSRALTMAVRLFGIDAVVEFRYDAIDLRPDSELETYKAVKQSRILELLSLGLMTDAEASLELTGTLPIPGMPALAGTRFKNGSDPIPANPDSNTSALQQTLTPKTPSGVKGK